MSTLTPSVLERPTLRLLAAPTADPPYEDGYDFDPALEVGAVSRHDPSPAEAAIADGQATLDLSFVLPTGLAVRPEAATAAEASEPDNGAFDRQPTATVALPDARSWSTRLAQAAVEVLSGSRPLSQLRRWTSDEVYAQLSRASRRRSLRVCEPRRRPDRPPRVIVRAVRVCEVADGVVEACAVVDDGRRARAIALRLEGADGRWRCTQLAAV